MAKKAKAATQWDDPSPYDGPIERADGRRPYNRYLWPMDGDYWFVASAKSVLVQRMAHPNRIAIVALADGRWTTDGSIHAVEEKLDCYGYPCVFDTREAALRAAVAHFIRTCRAARLWRTGPLKPHVCAEAINWALDIVRRPHVPVPAPPPPAARKTGLPLFDLEASDAR